MECESEIRIIIFLPLWTRWDNTPLVDRPWLLFGTTDYDKFLPTVQRLNLSCSWYGSL